MLVEIRPETLGQIRNPRLAAYASIYLRIQEEFMERVRATGMQVASDDDRAEVRAKLTRLARQGAVVRNDAKSVYINHISPACVACQTGLGSATFFISLKCHRSCYFCFNPNQESYEYFLTHQRGCIQELEQMTARGERVDHIALTGGEPLLHRDEMIEFFRFADEKFPNAYRRLYTSGDQLDRETLAALQSAHLNEIRFSIRMHDSDKARAHTYDRIALAREFVPNVMVEMPVVPGALAEMQQVLVRLEELQVLGINLLEFCFPLNNADAYRSRGFRLKNRPYRVLYNYHYAGGLPVAESELECLDLIEFALDRQLKLGVHYCSLENKHTGEIYQQHMNHTVSSVMCFSEKDYFCKSAKVFGKDIQRVLPLFQKSGYSDYQRNRDHYYLEFHPDQIRCLKGEDVEIGISTNVIEARADGEYVRELQVDLTTPQWFDSATDI